MVPCNFLLMQHNDFIYSAIGNESEGDTSLLGSHEQGHRSSPMAECKQTKK